MIARTRLYNDTLLFCTIDREFEIYQKPNGNFIVKQRSLNYWGYVNYHHRTFKKALKRCGIRI
jgi:hypothetical protein